MGSNPHLGAEMLVGVPPPAQGRGVEAGAVSPSLAVLLSFMEKRNGRLARSARFSKLTQG